MNRPGPEPSSVGGDDEQLGVGGARDQRLDAVEHEAVALAPGLRPELERVEEHSRLLDRERGRRDIVTGEGGKVGALLLAVSPEADAPC